MQFPVRNVNKCLTGEIKSAATSICRTKAYQRSFCYISEWSMNITSFSAICICRANTSNGGKFCYQFSGGVYQQQWRSSLKANIFDSEKKLRFWMYYVTYTRMLCCFYVWPPFEKSLLERSNKSLRVLWHLKHRIGRISANRHLPSLNS